MKTLPLVIGSAFGLVALLSPLSMHAEETATTAPAQAPSSGAVAAPTSVDLAAKLLADLLKQASAAATDSAAPATAAPADAQTQELQTLLISVLKTVAEMLPKFLATLDESALLNADGPFKVNIEDFLNGVMAPPAKDLPEEGLRSGGLKTSSLIRDGSPAQKSDSDWKSQFKQREPAR